MATVSKRKDQLDHILKDKSYWVGEGNGSYKDFVADMYDRVSKGYSLSEKQETAITNTVKTYAKYFFKKNDPDYKEKVDLNRQKISVIQHMLYQCGYTPSYETSADDFLKSIDGWVTDGKSLTLNQRKALNKMHKRFKKRVDKRLVS
jgi:hypothetical protein